LSISACSGILKLPPELLQIHTMLRRFPPANEDHWNIPTIALLEHSIVINIDLPEGGAEFSQERRDGILGFVAEVAPGARVEGHVAGPGSGKAGVFGISIHHFRANLHLTEERALLGRTGA
jgi:hypothetical protein